VVRATKLSPPLCVPLQLLWMTRTRTATTATHGTIPANSCSNYRFMKLGVDQWHETGLKNEECSAEAGKLKVNSTVLGRHTAIALAFINRWPHTYIHYTLLWIM